jgi:hypothetical protein
VPYNSYQHHRQRDGAIVALLFLNYALIQACCFPPGTAMSSGILVAPAAPQPCQADRLRLRFFVRQVCDAAAGDCWHYCVRASMRGVT